MRLKSRPRVLALAPVLALALLSSGTPPGGAHGATQSIARHDHLPGRSQVVLDWERILLRTVYTDAPTPVPTGVPVLGYTSLALYDAASAARSHGRGSATAAVATAAHDVLVHYYPDAAAKLDADLAKSLASVPDGPMKTRGISTGRSAAADMVASRAGDGYLAPGIHYNQAPAPGVWQPTPPATDMLAPWLGSLRHLVSAGEVPVPGPDALSSPAYAADFDEVRRLGRATSSERTPEQTATALFYNSNSATTVSDALIRRLEAHPIGLRTTARLFAAIHASMTDSVIRCWQLKRDVGFWRPDQAVAGAGDDGNAATTPETGWTPLVPTPNYSEYVSGHACLTAPAIETIRRTLGEHTSLELRSVNSPTPRVYTRLRDIERDAFNARIWSGLHFRRAMVDGYAIGHRTARGVLRELRHR